MVEYQSSKFIMCFRACLKIIISFLLNRSMRTATHHPLMFTNNVVDCWNPHFLKLYIPVFPDIWCIYLWIRKHKSLTALWCVNWMPHYTCLNDSDDRTSSVKRWCSKVMHCKVILNDSLQVFLHHHHSLMLTSKNAELCL